MCIGEPRALWVKPLGLRMDGPGVDQLSLFRASGSRVLPPADADSVSI